MPNPYQADDTSEVSIEEDRAPAFNKRIALTIISVSCAMAALIFAMYCIEGAYFSAVRMMRRQANDHLDSAMQEISDIRYALGPSLLHDSVAAVLAALVAFRSWAFRRVTSDGVKCTPAELKFWFAIAGVSVAFCGISIARIFGFH